MDNGKVWFITGAARGIGAEIARAALAAGHTVVATGRSLEPLQQVYREFGDTVLPLALDVADEAQAEAAVAAAFERFGRIDVLVNNAGYGLLGAFETLAAADIEAQFTTNVFGLMHVTRAALPGMRARRSGHVVNVSSIGGVTGFEGSSVYCATKFAVTGFSESLALELAPAGIAVTVVEPGFIRTDFLDGSSVRYGTRDTPDGVSTERSYSQYNGEQPGDPVRLAAAVLSLVAREQPPVHFLAGSDAVEIASTAVEKRQRELTADRALSQSVDGQF
ncbi:SDR family NAD(P)-dependent oxidoreductase [Piscinibacter gummiphilus]|nr:SDR family NAD(P)-dependent oxidoreductase [Piscinibacter gummiphilus]ATU64195.1 short-chain dehydrogenase/reductase [Piscinibacter gummiphilus]